MGEGTPVNSKVKSKTKARRAVWISFGTILIILLVLVLVNINKVLTLGSFKLVDDYPLYTMTYYGNYSFDYALKKADGKDATNTSGLTLPSGISYMCSSFVAVNQKGEPMLCRNLDYKLLGHAMALIRTDAPGKNASISMSDLYYLGYNKNNLPPKSLKSSLGLLAAPRIPIDGMNEYGVSMAILTVPFAQTTKDPTKDTIDEVAANRLILDHAKNVDEAVLILKEHNIQFREGPAHFMIADSSGKSAIVEFIGGEVKTIVKETPWQAVTNFIMSEESGPKEGLGRYNTICNTLEANDGRISEDEAMKLLSRVSGGTVWSVIYNLKTGEIRIAMGMKYHDQKTFHFTMRNPG